MNDEDFDLSSEEIIDALGPLIDSGRLTGKLFVDDVLVLDSNEQDRTEPDRVTYDEFGFSAHDDYGCVRIKAVDELLRDWMATGDEFEQAAARSTSERFGILVPGREYTDQQLKQVRANNQSQWSFGGAQFGQFGIYGGRYYNT